MLPEQARADWVTGMDSKGNALTDSEGGAIAYTIAPGSFSIKNIGTTLIMIDEIRIGGAGYFWPTSLSRIQPQSANYATTVEQATSTWKYDGPLDAPVEIRWHSVEEEITWGPWTYDAQDSRCSHRIGIRRKGPHYEHWLALKDLDPTLILDIKVWNGNTHQLIGTLRSTKFQADYRWSYVDDNPSANFAWTVVAEGG